MFKKLITNLPFNPSLLGQVSFYAKRLHEEQSIRRMGFGFMALAMFVQMFAVIAPPQKSLAYDSDYIINGLQNRDDILRAWDGKTSDQNVAQIYGKFGLTRADIAALPLKPNAYVTTNQADYWTIGRSSLSAVSRSGRIDKKYKDAEVPINYGSGTVYLRQLKAWDINNPVNTYRAFKGTKNGQNYWILVDCGNFTRVGKPPLNNPQVDLRKSIDGGPRALKPGDSFSFRFEYRNSTVNSPPAQNVVLTDTLDLTHFDIVSPTNLSINNNVLTLNLGDVPYSTDWKTAAVITVKLKTNLDNGSSICNAATLNSANGGSASSGGLGLCVSVLNPCPLDSTVPSANDPRCTTPTLVCSLTNTELNRTTKEATLKTTVTTSNALLTHIVSYNYAFGDNSTKKNNSTALTDTVKHVYKDGKYSATVTVSYTVGSDSKTVKSIACVADVETKPDQPLTPSKSAQNITQNLNNAQTIATKANPNDVIEYTLKTHNSYDYDRANYTVSDYIGDILDYANLDKTFLSAQGGSYDETTRTVSWVGKTIKANSDLTLKFRVTIKDPIPSTNKPSTLTTSFDCFISNKYGSEIAIPINCPPTKTVEQINTTLPNTGPGTSITIAAVIMVVISYFFFRSRLLAKEVELVRAEYATGGGF